MIGGGSAGGLFWGVGRVVATTAAGAFRPENLLRILGYLRPYGWHCIGILICIAATSGIGVVPPLLIRQLIDERCRSGMPCC